MVSPYDLGGKKANFENVFGKNPVCWVLPVKTQFSSGFDYHLLTSSKLKSEVDQSLVQEMESVA
ncbi:hypothetical protein MHBO_003876 [Bonamia ostreae]|uniref:Uncharacterized protein n=1 Tax=Bonamia ostreae TaxID=126728 RepID=A0ABV2ARS6_9EUKA